MNNKILRPLSAASSIGMLLVLLMGALVTQTGSGRGCGDDWPLCNGKFIPAYTIESFIEYSHRFVTGIVGLIVAATFIAVMLKVKRKDAKIYVSGVLFFTVLQAALGAMAVLWPQSSAVLALHFGISLLAFAFTVLLVAVIWQETSPTSGRSQIRVAVSTKFRGFVWFALTYCYVVVYLGAYIRHTKSAAGCSGWPLCNGQIVPELSGATGIVFMHRVAALLLFVILGLLALAARRERSSKSLRISADWSFLFVAMQVLSGALVTFSIGNDWYLFASMLHTLLISCLFSILCYLSIIVIPAGTTKPAVR